MKWSTFARNQSKAFAGMDFFVVPTLTFRRLYGFFIIRHGTRELLHFGVTYRPTQLWVAEQLRMAAERLVDVQFMIHDNDPLFSPLIKRTMKSMGITSMPTAVRSPWENGIAERWVGSVRRELLDYVIIINQRHLYKLLEEYVEYYNTDRTHLSLGKDSPAGRPVQKKQSDDDKLIALPRLGGLHHKYEWRQAA
ncbi:MAG: transposase family protein [FCB group bacterium]|nr:transposase family protein [FCB group bacterium]